jgi:hypothetical protein
MYLGGDGRIGGTAQPVFLTSAHDMAVHESISVGRPANTSVSMEEVLVVVYAQPMR